MRCPALLAAFLLPAAAAQAPPGPPMPSDLSVLAATPADGSPAATRWQFGKEALAAGRPDEAVPHLLAALEYHPASPPLLLDLLRATAAAPDARGLWLQRFAAAAADQKGLLKLDPQSRKVLTTDKVLAEELKAAGRLAEQRAQAAQELARSVERLQPRGKAALGQGALARWHGELLLALASGAPALLSAHGPGCQATLDRQAAAFDLLLPALLRVLEGQAKPAGTSTGPEAAAAVADRALRAARVLAGLSRQAAFGKDLKGPPPPELGELPAKASAVLGKAAAEGLAKAKVWTVPELEALDPAQREAFTAAHQQWTDPAVAVSPGGRYRVETVCGFESLLGVARTVELHHARLVGHFGSDPFLSRQGTVRIVPEHHDLETEGAPFWWAGGFQGGDRTVLRFAWNNIPGLGRGLTHELTHRFDGVLSAFVPAWFGEGHAQWTAGHYGRMADLHCVEDFLDSGTCAHTFYKGYAEPGKLRQLLEGKPEDYRDNYFAGYSLYAFLRGWPPKQPPKYRSALQRFSANARAGSKDPLAYFTATFCDGKEGRPGTLEGFMEEWHDFLLGCYRWQDPETRDAENAWVAAYGDRGPGDQVGEDQPYRALVMDPPTWSWARARAEPWFGQGHAGPAAAVLAEAGETEAAAAAALWSLQVDGWRRETAEQAVALLQQVGRREAAAALAALSRERYGAPADALVPMLAGLPRLRSYADALAAAAAAAGTAGHRITEAALAAEHRRLALLLGLPAAGDQLPAAAPPPPPRALSWAGLGEDGLVGFEDRRVPGLWFPTPEGDLHVGREKPRDATGVRDRAAHYRDAFVHAVAWCGPGDYVVRARIHFTTSFVSGAVVLGHWRRDRGLRIPFHAGSARYASGKDDADDKFRGVHLSLEGQWERDGRLPATAPAQTVDFAAGASWFDLELHVRGPSVLVKANGEALFRYTTHDGSPIEGHVGFAMNRGAIRVQQATVQELAAGAPAGLDPSSQPTTDLDGLLMLPTAGLPRHPDGTLVLWLPPPAEGEALDHLLPRALPVLARLLKDTLEHPQPWLLAVPAGSDAAAVAAVQQRLAEFRSQPLPLLEHKVGAPFTGYPWVLFVDADGVLRAAAEAGDATLHTRVEKWARMFRRR